MARRFTRFLRRNTIALLALFIALSGTTYAASSALLPKNSVGTPQLKNGAVTKKKINKKTIKALKGNRGLQGLQGPKGATGATGPFPDPLASGKTLRGTYAMQANVNGSQIRTGISFGFSLAAAPTPHYIKIGDAIPTGCTGGTLAAPKADPGHLCIYEGVAQGVSANRGEVDPVDDAAPNIKAEKYGAGAYATCNATTCLVEGTWAVTAP